MENIIERSVIKKIQRILMIQNMTRDILRIYRDFQRTLTTQKGFQAVLMIACATLINKVRACAAAVYTSSV